MLNARNAVGVVSTALSICYLQIATDRASFVSVADADAIRDKLIRLEAVKQIIRLNGLLLAYTSSLTRSTAVDVIARYQRLIYQIQD